MASVEHDTVLSVLTERAHRLGDKTLLRIDGQEISYARALDAVSETAAGLAAVGVHPGDRVAIMTDNRQEAVWAWLGANAASAIDVPLNTAAQGQFLQGQLDSARPKAVIGTVDYLERIAGLGLSGIDVVVSVGQPVDKSLFPNASRHLSFEDLAMLGRESGSRIAVAPEASSVATIMYTSGTTGPSKGVQIPQRYYSVWGRRAASYLEMLPGEVIYCVQPLFHVDARAYLQNALFSEGTSVIGTRFSASNFWEEIRANGANVFSCIGTMMWMLFKQPESERDRDHDVRMAGGAATPAEIHRAFEDRFGLQVREAYGMTESLFLAHASGQTPVGSVGSLVPELEGRLVDDDDRPVEAGESGELIIREREPFCTFRGYWPGSAETESAGAGDWFHTGDLLRTDEEGNLYFIGRKKDSIRRRGENVSAWEVEEAAMRHPDVLEAAVIGVPSPVGEEDVALLARLRPQSEVDPAGLRQFVAGDLPAFAVPRYVEFVEAFPMTPSERVDKGKVRAAGLSSRAWDAENLGTS